MAIRSAARIGSSGAPSYNFVVGSTGNYPATSAGLQAAIEDANGSPIFIQAPGISDPTPVPFSVNASLVGACGENNTFIDGTYAPGGLFTDYTDSSTKTTIVCPLRPDGNTGLVITLDNLVYLPSAIGLDFGDVASSGQRITFRATNCVCASFPEFIHMNVASGNDQCAITVYNNNSTFFGYNNDEFAVLTNSGGGAFSQIQLYLHISGGGTHNYQFTPSALASGSGYITVYITVLNKSVYAGSFQKTSGGANTVGMVLSLIDATAIIFQDAIVDSFDYCQIYQQNVLYVGNTDFEEQYVLSNTNNVTLYNNIDNTAPLPATNVQLVNCFWSDDSDQVEQLYNSTSPIIDGEACLNTPAFKLSGIPTILPAPTVPGTVAAFNYIIPLPNVTAAGAIGIPDNCYLVDILILNNTANAVTGGIKVGTTMGGADVISTVAVGANAQVSAGSSIIKSYFPGSTSLYYDAVSSFNSADLDIRFIFMPLP